MYPPIARPSIGDACKMASVDVTIFFSPFPSILFSSFFCVRRLTSALSSSVEQSEFNPDLITRKTDLPGVWDAFRRWFAFDAVTTCSIPLSHRRISKLHFVRLMATREFTFLYEISFHANHRIFNFSDNGYTHESMLNAKVEFVKFF